MRSRCESQNDAKYPDYGGRGIKVCDRWRHDFAAFLVDVGPRPSPSHSLDRFPDNDRGYEPDNVRWATASEQQRNTRRNRLVTYHGETRPLCEWAEVYQLDYHVVRDRLARGWPPERAFTAPIIRKRARRPDD